MGTFKTWSTAHREKLCCIISRASHALEDLLLVPLLLVKATPGLLGLSGYALEERAVILAARYSPEQ